MATLPRLLAAHLRPPFPQLRALSAVGVIPINVRLRTHGTERPDRARPETLTCRGVEQSLGRGGGPQAVCGRELGPEARLPGGPGSCVKGLGPRSQEVFPLHLRGFSPPLSKRFVSEEGTMVTEKFSVSSISEGGAGGTQHVYCYV